MRLTVLCDCNRLRRRSSRIQTVVVGRVLERVLQERERSLLEGVDRRVAFLALLGHLQTDRLQTRKRLCEGASLLETLRARFLVLLSRSVYHLTE